MTSLLVTSFKLLSLKVKIQLLWRFTLLIIIEIIKNNVLLMILNDQSTYVLLYILLMFSDTFIVKFILDKYMLTVSEEIKLEYIKNGIEKYNGLSFDSKNKVSSNMLYSKLNRVGRAISDMIKNGYDSIFNIIKIFIIATITFYKKDLIIYFCVTIAINFIQWYFIIRKKQAEMTKINKINSDDTERLRNKINLLLPMFQQMVRSPDMLFKLIKSIKVNALNNYNLWSWIMLISELNSNIGIIIIGLAVHTQALSFITIILTLEQIKTCVKNITVFLNRYNEYHNDMVIYDELWLNLDFKLKKELLDLPSILNVKSCNIKYRSDSTIKINDLLIDLNNNEKIKITGVSGSGKTTFMRGLSGETNGICLIDDTTMDQYVNKITVIQQDNSSIPFKDITIRDLFDDEINDELILSAMKICFCENDFNMLLKNLKEKSSKENKSEKNPLDIYIQNIFSGGERQRMILSIGVYDALKKNSKIIFIDEPEQYLDKETRKFVINNLMKIFNNVNVIIVTHVCDCEITYKWTRELYIINGIVSQK